MGAAGIRVSVLCPRVHDAQPEVERLHPGVHVYRKTVPAPVVLKRVWSSWVLRFPAWQRVLEQFVEDHRVDVLHVRDLPMLRTTLAVGKRWGLPVVADFYENWPAAVESYRGDRSRLYQLIISLSRGQFLYRWHERRSVRHCERIVVVVPESAERFTKAGFSPEKFVVVSNTEDETTLKIPETAPKDEGLNGRWVAIYTGSVGAHRGLDTVFRAVPEIVRQIPNFLLLVLGVAEPWSSKLREMARLLDVEAHIEIRGWTPLETCLDTVLSSQVGLVPHNDFEHTQTTVPHKLFQYMLCGRPVVVSDCRPLKRIVTEAEAGLVFRANDSHDCARAIIQLAGDDEACRQYGDNGRKAAKTTFAWKNDASRLVNMYREMATRYRWEFSSDSTPQTVESVID